MKKGINKFLGLCFITSLVACSSTTQPFYAPTDKPMKWFDHGTFGETQIYNYCPSTFIENNERYVYYCSNLEEGNVTDYVAHRHATYDKKKGWEWSDIDYVLGPTSGTWDARHTCDPSVTKGVFSYQGETYSYLMAYLGSIQSDNNGNETGIAVSKSPEGPWIKCDDVNPLIPYDRENAIWGTGQPSIINVDEQGDVVIFYSVGNKDGTYEEVREYNLTNIDNPVLLQSARVPTYGLQSGDSLICDADVCYDVENQKLLLVKGKIPYSPDGNSPSFIASTLVVYYMDLSDSERPIDEIFKGNNAKPWKLLTEIGYEKTGFMRNHNAGLSTDPYGHLIAGTDFIEVAFTRSDLANSEWNWLSTYRIYSISAQLTYLEN